MERATRRHDGERAAARVELIHSLARAEGLDIDLRRAARSAPSTPTGCATWAPTAAGPMK
ncbi:hypothetical protein AB0I81_01880 [Nonomuraea sp. NPDC050404]|uniref:hypothetical protein n=1 Tax=Nonomuraea sp. NPDC050404 TaxID=3155783 RepID=UPI0033C45615